MSNYTIWKAALQPLGVQTVAVPVGAEILCAREQHEHVCIWFRCDPGKSIEHRVIAMVGTGHAAPPPEQAKYLGTASLQGGVLILHVFEKTK